MTEILSFISVLIIMLLLRSLVSIFPSLAACLVRSKESFNLEASVKLSRNRDLLALAMIVPFCLVAMRFRFKGVGMIDTMSNDIQTLIIIGCFIVYILFRLAVQNLFRPHSIPKKTYETAAKASRTFFIILTLVLLCAGGIISLFDFDMMASRNAISNFHFFLLYFHSFFVPLRPRNHPYRNFGGFSDNFIDYRA